MTKITPTQLKEAKKLRESGMTYDKIGKKLGYNKNLIQYNLNEEYKERARERSRVKMSKLSKEDIRLKNQKNRVYLRDYMRRKYQQDPEFKKKHLAVVHNYQIKSTKYKEYQKKRWIKK